MDERPQLPPQVVAALAQDNLGPKTLALVYSFTFLALISVALRFFSRIKLTKIVGWEDYFIGISMVFSILAGVSQIKQVQAGAGKHTVLVPLPKIIESLKYLYFSILAYAAGSIFTKVSICQQYKRIFAVADSKLPIYIVMALCVGAATSAFFTFAFSCIPVEAFWDLTLKPTSRCINDNAARFAHGFLNMITDLMVALLPVPAIWRLQLVRRQKIALVCLLCVGWIVCIISALRIQSLFVFFRHPKDPLYYAAPPIYWASIEQNLSIVCACVPAMKPLVVRIVPAFTSFTKSLTRSGNGNSSVFGKYGKSSVTNAGAEVELGDTSRLRDDFMPPPPVYGKHNIRVEHEITMKSDAKSENESARRCSEGSGGSEEVILNGRVPNELA
ncbi:unnamed protein product [Alternaria alternata]